MNQTSFHYRLGAGECQVDVTGMGELWDRPTAAKLQWGLRNPQGTEYGRITLKDGTSRISGRVHRG
jgi:hypothetical protein